MAHVYTNVALGCFLTVYMVLLWVEVGWSCIIIHGNFTQLCCHMKTNLNEMFLALTETLIKKWPVMCSDVSVVKYI